MAKNSLGIAAALAFAAFASAPAQAGTYLFNLAAAPTSTSGGTSNGNAFYYTAGSGLSAVNLKVTAWSINTTTGPDTVTNAILNRWSGGLGVDNRNEPSSSPDHSIDNSNSWIDFVLLQFDHEVDMNSINIGWAQNDSDVTVRWGDVGGTWNATPALHNQSVGTLDALIDGQANYTVSSAATGTRNVNASNQMANWWIISALTPNTGNNDYFKLKSVTVNAYPPLPEPGTWMTMILGFGAIGGAMRRRRAIAAPKDMAATA